MRNIPEFLRSNGLSLYCDIEAKLREIHKQDIEKMVDHHPTLRRINSASSYGESFQGYIKSENKSSKKALKKYNKELRGSEGDITTSGFVEDFTGYSYSRTASYSNIESVID